MDLAGLVVFAAALAVAAASPGPAVVAIVARVLGRGTEGSLAFAAGIALGDVVWLSFAIAGLAVLAETFHAAFLAVKWAGVLYLLYLAWGLWRAPDAPRALDVRRRSDHPLALFAAGLALTLGNPKVVVFYLALLPTLLDLAAVTPLGYAELVLVTLAVLAAVFGSYVVLAARARALLASPRAVRLVNRGSACTMAGAAGWVASR